MKRISVDRLLQQFVFMLYSNDIRRIVMFLEQMTISELQTVRDVGNSMETLAIREAERRGKKLSTDFQTKLLEK